MKPAPAALCCPCSTALGTGSLQFAAGKQVSKEVATELRLEEAKRTIQRMAYIPTFLPTNPTAVDAELRRTGVGGGLRIASAEQRREAERVIKLQSSSGAVVLAAWTARTFRKVHRSPSGAPASSGVPHLKYDEFKSAIRRYAKVTPKDLPDPELQLLFGRIDGDGDGLVGANDFERYLSSPAEERLQSFLSSAGAGKLQRVQTIAHGKSSQDEAWAYVPQSDQEGTGAIAAHAAVGRGGTVGGGEVQIVALTAAQRTSLWRQWDVTNQGTLSAAEVAVALRKAVPVGWACISGGGGKDCRREIELAVRYADVEGSGYIVPRDFEAFLKLLAFFVTLRRLCHRTDGDGCQLREEFVERCCEWGYRLPEASGNTGHAHHSRSDHRHSDENSAEAIAEAIACDAGGQLRESLGVFALEYLQPEAWGWAQLIKWVQDMQQQLTPATSLASSAVAFLTAKDIDACWSRWDWERSHGLALADVVRALQRDPPRGWQGLDNSGAIRLAFQSAVGDSGLLSKRQLSSLLKYTVYFHVLWDAFATADAEFARWMAQTQCQALSWAELVQWASEHQSWARAEMPSAVGPSPSQLGQSIADELLPGMPTASPGRRRSSSRAESRESRRMVEERERRHAMSSSAPHRSPSPYRRGLRGQAARRPRDASSPISRNDASMRRPGSPHRTASPERRAPNARSSLRERLNLEEPHLRSVPHRSGSGATSMTSLARSDGSGSRFPVSRLTSRQPIQEQSPSAVAGGGAGRGRARGALLAGLRSGELEAVVAQMEAGSPVATVTPVTATGARHAADNRGGVWRTGGTGTDAAVEEIEAELNARLSWADDENAWLENWSNTVCTQTASGTAVMARAASCHLRSRQRRCLRHCLGVSLTSLLTRKPRCDVM